MKYVYDIDGNLITVAFEGTDEEIKEQYKETVFISEIELGVKAKVENGTIRAYTRLDKINDGLESLQEGEYIKDNEISYIEKPSNYHIWDSKTNKWVHDKELEINSLEEELGSLELTIYSKSQEIENLKKAGKTFAAKKLEKEVIELQKQFDEKLSRYEELEG